MIMDETKDNRDECEELKISEPKIVEQTTSIATQSGSEAEHIASWFSSFVDAAKQKSVHALEFMKRDLTEFKDTLQENTTAALSSTAAYIGGTIVSLNPLKDEEQINEQAENLENKKSKESDSIPGSQFQQKDMLNFLSDKAKSLFNSIRDAMVPHYEDDDEIYVMSGGKAIIIDKERWQLLIKAIQSDPQTYCHEPEGPPDDYDSWLVTFNLIDYEEKIKQLLSSEAEVKSYYEKLVPHSLTPGEFWHRYFYKIHQLRQLELQRMLSKSENENEQLPKNDNIEKEKEVENSKDNTSQIKTDEKKSKITESLSEIDESDKKSNSSTTPSEANKQSDGSDDWETEFIDILNSKNIDGSKIHELVDKNFSAFPDWYMD